MSQFWKTKKFSELNNEWAKKLAESGFIDIEKEIKGDRVLIEFSKNAYRTRDRIYIESKSEFFELITQAVNNDRQMPARDRYIMHRYGEGIKQCQIKKELIERSMGCHRTTIIKTISAYLHKWRIPILKPGKTTKRI